MQTEKVCYISGQTNNLHRHHIYAGARRQISEDNGFWVWLAPWLHNQSIHGVHGKDGRELDLLLKRHCQMEYEKSHTRTDFIKLIGKSYL